MTVNEIAEEIRDLVEREGTEDVRAAIDLIEAQMLVQDFECEDSDGEPCIAMIP